MGNRKGVVTQIVVSHLFKQDRQITNDGVLEIHRQRIGFVMHRDHQRLPMRGARGRQSTIEVFISRQNLKIMKLQIPDQLSMPIANGIARRPIIPAHQRTIFKRQGRERKRRRIILNVKRMTEIFQLGSTGKTFKRRSAIPLDQIAANHLNDIAKRIVMQVEKLFLRVVFYVCHGNPPVSASRLLRWGARCGVWLR